MWLLYSELKKVITYIMYPLDSSMMCLKVIFDLYECMTMRTDLHMLMFIFNRVIVWCLKHVMIDLQICVMLDLS